MANGLAPSRTPRPAGRARPESRRRPFVGAGTSAGTRDEATLEKLFHAERSVAYVRVAIIVLNSAVYLALMEHAHRWHGLALTIIVIANAYGLYVLLGRPYERLPLLASASYTVTVDAGLISAWLVATGGFESPFYVLWYVSVAAVAFRFGPRPTVAAASTYTALYLAILVWDGAFPAAQADVVVRVSYIFFAAAVGALLSQETYRQTKAKRLLQDRTRELDEAVKARTREVEESRTRLEESLRGLQDAHERLQELDLLKTRFINAAAHELSTPLTPVRMQVSMLSRGQHGRLNDAQQRAAEIVERNVVRLERLVRDVLDVARMQGPGLRIRPVRTDAADVAAQVVAEYGAVAEAQGTELEFEAAPAWVEADPERLYQVIGNLVHNALKFTGGGKVRVTVRPDDGTTIEVQDSGRGLTQEQMGRLFRPFVQVHEVQAPGTGLGLFICKGIVEAHGGTVGVTSDGPGHGVTFRVHLPAAAKPTTATLELPSAEVEVGAAVNEADEPA